MTIKDGNTIETLEEASSILKGGGLIGFPTETVYGLAADATNADAIAKIFAVKNRPHFNPLIVHVTGIDMAKRYAKIDTVAETLIHHFWPGPLTLVVPLRGDCGICDAVTAGLDSIAMRAPEHPIASSILTLCDRPLAAPSANLSGEISPTTAQHVFDGLGHMLPLIVDGGAASVGIESTIVGVKDGTITLLREGIITKDQIALKTGFDVKDNKENKITAPGQLLRHYAPKKPLRLSAFAPDDNEIMIGFGAVDGPLNLSPAGNLEEAASNLFAMLRLADQSEKETIAVAPIPFEGCGIAINDRLSRAANRDGNSC